MKTFAIFFALAAFASLPAAAQQGQPPVCPGHTPCPQQATTDRTATPPATVGHRQPTMKDLTPQLRHDETTGSGAPDPLGPLPKICRDC